MTVKRQISKILLCGAVCILPGVLSVEGAVARNSPNVVIYMIDDLGWNQISVDQATRGTHKGAFQTPHLEKLAQSGLSFTHAYMQPNCAPSRAAVLSGQYPARVHNDVYVVRSLNRYKAPGLTRDQARFLGPKQSQDVAAEAITLAEALQKNGYATAHVGKYHVGAHGDDPATLPENQGFDINIGGFSQGHQPVCFAKQKKEGWTFPGLARGDLDRFGEPYTEAYVQKYGLPASQVGEPKHVCDALADAMEETVQKLHDTGKPFYLQLHAYAVHGPVISRPDLRAAAAKRLPAKQKNKAELAGFIAGMDHTLGRLLAAINDPNGDGDTSDTLSENTLILFTSDNGGTHFDNAPLRGVKGMFTEGGIRVPLIASWPGVIPANTLTDRLVHGIDFYPTCLDLSGGRWRPAEEDHPLDGESFVDVLSDPDSENKRGPIFYLFPGYLDVRAQPCAMVIDEVDDRRYKLLYFYEADAWELYDLNEDVGEEVNVVNHKPELALTLSKKLHDWLTKEHRTWNPKYPIDKETGRSAGPPPQFSPPSL